MVIVDSSIWIDTLNGVTNRHTMWLKAAFGRHKIGLTTLILCEVLQGLRSEAQFGDYQIVLLGLPVFETIDRHIAVAAARNYRTLRSRGISVRNTSDCLIATFCIENRFSLLHNDRDYNAFERHLGLSVIEPPALPLN